MDLRQAVLDDEVLPVEARTLDLGAVAVAQGERRRFAGLLEVLGTVVDALGNDVVLVERFLLVLARLLFDGVDVAERVVDFVELDDFRDFADGAEDAVEPVETQLDDAHPRGQVAQRREAPLHPEFRDAFVEQAGHGGFDVVGEVGLALLRELQQEEGFGHDFAQLVDALELLDEAVLERLALLPVNADFGDFELAAGEVWRLVVRDTVCDKLHLLRDDLRRASAPASFFLGFVGSGVQRQNVEQEAEHRIRE